MWDNCNVDPPHNSLTAGIDAYNWDFSLFICMDVGVGCPLVMGAIRDL